VIVFDLRCDQDHVFEAWFGSTGDFESQTARGLVTCPICDSRAVEKAVMAPAIGPKSNQQSGVVARKEELRTLALMQAEVEARCDYVGDRFAEEARRLHAAATGPKAAGNDIPNTGKPRQQADPAPPRGIIGEATIAAVLDLVAEGIPVAPLPFRSRHRADA